VLDVKQKSTTAKKIKSKKMKYVIKQESQTETVVIKASGIINTKVAEKMVLATGLELATTNFQRCFFDLANTEVDPNQTMADMFNFIAAFKKANIKKSVKMAALYTSGATHRLILEKAAIKELVKLKHFTDRNAALNWLYQ